MMTMLLGSQLFLAGGFAAAMCGIAMLAWALFADRSHGKKRCCKCWYLMDGLDSLRCPECGHTAKDERALYRTRRRWKRATLSLLPLLLAAFLFVQPKVQRDGWGSVMPATALIVLLRFDDRQWVLDGIEYHISEAHANLIFVTPMHVPAEDRLWRWQWRLLARSILSRMEDEESTPRRTAYHQWLRVSADAGGSTTLRQTCIDALIRELAHQNSRVRTSAALCSIDYQDIEGSIERAVGLLDHEDSQTRVAGVMSLRLIAGETGQGVSDLIEALQHEDAEVRKSALSAISSTARYHDRPVPEAIDPVYAMEHDEDNDVRYHRIRVLANLQEEEEAWNTIHAALRHEDPHVRRGGLDAAADRRPRPPAVSLLMLECLGDPDADVRQTAIWVLPYIDSDVFARHADLLETLLTHDDINVRIAVVDIIRPEDDSN